MDHNIPFDPLAFLEMPIEEKLERRPPISIGDYTAVISDVVPRQWQSKDKVDESGQLKSGIALDITIKVDVPAAERERVNLKTEQLVLRDGIMLDMLPGNRGLDTSPGRNTRLRMYRDALNMNKSGETFRFQDMKGRLLKVRIGHEQQEVNGVKTGDLVEKIAGLAMI